MYSFANSRNGKSADKFAFSNNAFSLNKKSSENWPSLLNYKVDDEQEEKVWVTCINKENYRYTASMYTSPTRKKFMKWIMVQDFADKEEIMYDMGAWSTSPCFMEEMPLEYKKFTDSIFGGAIEHDNVTIVDHIMKKQSGTFPKIFYAQCVHRALDKGSHKCAEYLIKRYLFSENFVSANCIGGWAGVFSNKNLHTVTTLSKFLNFTFIQQNYLFSPNVFFLLHGNEEKVKNVLKKCNCQLPCSCNWRKRVVYLPLVACRIPECNWVENVFYKNALEISNSNRPKFYKDLSSLILSSFRSSHETGEIIKALNKKGIVFTRCSNVDITEVSLKGWVALLDNLRLFDLRSFVMEKNFLNGCLFRPENRPLLEKILNAICKNLLPETNARLFLSLGSSISKWGQDRGLIGKFKDPKKIMEKAAQVGNVYMMALAADQIEETVDISHFNGMEVHPETGNFIMWWSTCTREEKSSFLKDTFGDYFYDTSRMSNHYHLTREYRNKIFIGG